MPFPGVCTLGLLCVGYLQAVNTSAKARRNSVHVWLLSKHLCIILGNLSGLRVNLKVTKCAGTLKTHLLSVNTAVLASWLLGVRSWEGWVLLTEGRENLVMFEGPSSFSVWTAVSIIFAAAQGKREWGSLLVRASEATLDWIWKHCMK